MNGTPIIRTSAPAGPQHTLRRSSSAHLCAAIFMCRHKAAGLPAVALEWVSGAEKFQ